MNIEQRLARHPFTQGMSEKHLQLLALCATPVTFRVNEFIFRAGAPATGFYLIESGKVALEGAVEEHGKVASDVVGPGEPLGWSWLFPPYEWHFDARAVEPVIGLELSADRLHQHRDDDLAFGHELFRRSSAVLVRRLQHTRKQLLEGIQKGQS